MTCLREIDSCTLIQISFVHSAARHVGIKCRGISPRSRYSVKTVTNEWDKDKSDKRMPTARFISSYPPDVQHQDSLHQHPKPLANYLQTVFRSKARNNRQNREDIFQHCSLIGLLAREKPSSVPRSIPSAPTPLKSFRYPLNWARSAKPVTRDITLPKKVRS